MAKGPQFERDVCRQLSLWWTGGERDDVFWRTHGSGARATTRHKAGKRTAGQYGDIAASDPVGAALVRCITFSLKRGYNRHTLHDLLDMPEKAAKQVWEKWVAEIRQTARDAGTPFWAIIAKRDRREPLIILPRRFAAQVGFSYPFQIRSIVGLQFQSFLKQVRPSEVLNLVV